MLGYMAAAGCLLAVLPAALFIRNLGLYRPPPLCGAARSRCSVLIPARNEELNIGSTLHAVLSNTCTHFEVIVLDDGSTDRTAISFAKSRGGRSRWKRLHRYLPDGVESSTPVTFPACLV
jgi:cellulose synthase/poly-beta-1,6-N-acetylglucosamine synthase-like glycosyltransferase